MNTMPSTSAIEAGIKRYGIKAWAVRDVLAIDPRACIIDALEMLADAGEAGRAAAVGFAAECAERADRIDHATGAGTRAGIYARRAQSAARAARRAHDLASVEGLAAWAVHCSTEAAYAAGGVDACDAEREWQRDRLAWLADSLPRYDLT